ncbi:hypothetical protein ABVT39_015361 [Epinephelus coioides]
MATSGLLAPQSLRLQNLSSAEQLSATPQTAFILPLKITNRVFSNALLDQTSPEYKTMFQEVSDLLRGVYGCSETCPTSSFYGGPVEMTFRYYQYH